MSIEAKANLILEQAQEVARDAKTWADFSNALFDQSEGLVAKTFRDPMEREAFYDTEQYKKLNALFERVVKRHGVKRGATPEAAAKSGRILLRMPITLHNVLEVEAKKEGISLNQLAVSKLSIPMRDATDSDTKKIVAAFKEVHGGYAPDRVVVDPALNRKFLEACRDLGMTQLDYSINHALFDIRKSGKAKLPECTKMTVFRDQSEYQFGAEIAVRILQRTKGVTLDHILCDPLLVRQFDSLCLPLVREKDVLKLRWSALNLRKTRRLSPEDAAIEGTEYKVLSESPIKKLDLSHVPTHQATYVFYDANRPIFAGETDHLRDRIGLHLEPGRLPSWINLHDPAFRLKYFEAGKAKEDRLRWLRQFINMERPLLNYQEVA